MRCPVEGVAPLLSGKVEREQLIEHAQLVGGCGCICIIWTLGIAHSAKEDDLVVPEISRVEIARLRLLRRRFGRSGSGLCGGSEPRPPHLVQIEHIERIDHSSAADKTTTEEVDLSAVVGCIVTLIDQRRRSTN